MVRGDEEMRMDATMEKAKDRAPGAAAELEPEAVLPEQLVAGFGRGATLQPEKRLMLAVLEDAVTCYMREAVQDPRLTTPVFRDAEGWIVSDDAVWPFSFLNICRTLDIEPSAIRRGLRDWRERQRALAPERRATVRSPFRRMNGTRTKTRAHAPGLKLAG